MTTKRKWLRALPGAACLALMACGSGDDRKPGPDKGIPRPIPEKGVPSTPPTPEKGMFTPSPLPVPKPH